MPIAICITDVERVNSEAFSSDSQQSWECGLCYQCIICVAYLVTMSLYLINSGSDNWTVEIYLFMIVNLSILHSIW